MESTCEKRPTGVISKKTKINCFLCGIIYCSKEKRKVSAFSVPNSKLESWQQKVSGLASDHKLCDIHFDPEDIIKGITIGNQFYPYKRPKLGANAIPKQFLTRKNTNKRKQKPLELKEINSKSAPKQGNAKPLHQQKYRPIAPKLRGPTEPERVIVNNQSAQLPSNAVNNFSVLLGDHIYAQCSLPSSEPTGQLNCPEEQPLPDGSTLAPEIIVCDSPSTQTDDEIVIEDGPASCPTISKTSFQVNGLGTELALNNNGEKERNAEKSPADVASSQTNCDDSSTSKNKRTKKELCERCSPKLSRIQRRLTENRKRLKSTNRQLKRTKLSFHKSVENSTSRIANLESTVKDLKKKSFESVISVLPQMQQTIIRLFLMKQKTEKKAKNNQANGMKYDSDYLKQAVLLKSKSNEAYNYIREEGLLPLPSRSTITKLLNSSNNDPTSQTTTANNDTTLT